MPMYLVVGKTEDMYNVCENKPRDRRQGRDRFDLFSIPFQPGCTSHHSAPRFSRGESDKYCMSNIFVN